jgi:hypothetical protein
MPRLRVNTDTNRFIFVLEFFFLEFLLNYSICSQSTLFADTHIWTFWSVFDQTHIADNIITVFVFAILLPFERHNFLVAWQESYASCLFLCSSHEHLIARPEKWTYSLEISSSSSRASVMTQVLVYTFSLNSWTAQTCLFSFFPLPSIHEISDLCSFWVLSSVIWSSRDSCSWSLERERSF